MISCPVVKKHSIRWHYDLLTLFYRLLWGAHIHHGLWERDESPRRAQIELMESLAERAGIRAGDRVLDVGCGMGGSSIHLARWRKCRATGITISPLQRVWADFTARIHGVGRQTEFRCADVEMIEYPDESYDVVWSIECTEHLFDKPGFFERSARWLTMGGRMAVCAWLAGDDVLDESRAQQVYDVCEAFLCPSLGSASDYQRWIERAGLTTRGVEDWTPRVRQTWEICRRRVARSRLRGIARLLRRETALFLDRFETILNAYDTGAMKYGCFVAERTTGSGSGKGSWSERHQAKRKTPERVTNLYQAGESGGGSDREQNKHDTAYS
jgi:tocopherol O-methyltransferase